MHIFLIEKVSLNTAFILKIESKTVNLIQPSERIIKTVVIETNEIKSILQFNFDNFSRQFLLDLL